MNKYYIWSIEHQAWWKPGHMGYTINISEAGKFVEDEAIKICEKANIVKTQETMIPVSCIHKEVKVKPQLPGPVYVKEWGF